MKFFLASGFFCLSNLWAQGTIVSVAGTDFTFPTQPVRATVAPTGLVVGLAFDGDGNLYVINSANWDLEGHAAATGLVPSLGAVFATPPGLGVVDGDEIPNRA